LQHFVLFSIPRKKYPKISILQWFSFFLSNLFFIFFSSSCTNPTSTHRILTRFSHSRVSFMPRYTCAFELNILKLQPSCIIKKAHFKSLAVSLRIALFPYDHVKIFVLSKTFVCIYYTKSIRIGSTNKTGWCAKVSHLTHRRESEHSC